MAECNRSCPGTSLNARWDFPFGRRAVSEPADHGARKVCRAVSLASPHTSLSAGALADIQTDVLSLWARKNRRHLWASSHRWGSEGSGSLGGSPSVRRSPLLPSFDLWEVRDTQLRSRGPGGKSKAQLLPQGRLGSWVTPGGYSVSTGLVPWGFLFSQ